MKKRRRNGPETAPDARRIVLRFWPVIRNEGRLLAVSMLALFAAVGFRVLEPWPFKFIFDQLLHGKAAGGNRIPFLAGLQPLTLIIISAAMIVVINGLRAVADYANTVGFAVAGNRILTQVRGDLYRHLQGLSLSFHTKARSGDLILRVMSDVNLLKDVVVTAALPLLANLLILVGMIGVMFGLEWRLALAAVATLPLFWLCTVHVTPRIQRAARNQRKREATMAATAAESIGAIKIVHALGLEDLFDRGFSNRNLESQREDVNAARLTASLGRWVALLNAVSTALVLGYGGWLVLEKEITGGDLLVFWMYLRTAIRPMRDFAKHTGRLAKATAAGERVLELLDQVPEVRDLPNAVPASPFQGAVHFEGLTFAYEPKRPVVEEIEFAVDAGQHVALIGPSGIGKSTLASLMLRLYDPIKGRLLIDGRDIREYTLASLRAQISMVLQDSILFAVSVRDNIAFGATGATAAEIEEAAHLANAHEFIRLLPRGYDTILGERGVTLSGGQRQRIAVARAAIRKAPILILDEPTAGLDEENERAVLEALERLAEGRTTFFITHDLRLAARADLILYLEGGRVLEQGTHAELIRTNHRYAALFQLQRSAFDETPPLVKCSRLITELDLAKE